MKNYLTLLVACMAMSGCGLWSDAKPYLRSAKDIALDLCMLVGAEQAKDGQVDGMSVGDWCRQAQVISPFLDDVLASRLAGASRVSAPPAAACPAPAQVSPAAPAAAPAAQPAAPAPSPSAEPSAAPVQ